PFGVIEMCASTNVFTAGTLLPAVPSVVTVNGVGVPGVPGQVGGAGTLPGVGEVNVIVHWPWAFGCGAAPVHVPVGAVCVAPFESVSVKSTCAFWNGTKPAPLPRSSSRSTVNVCGWLTSFVAFGVIEIRALTHVLVAGPELPAVPFVVRSRATPPT